MQEDKALKVFELWVPGVSPLSRNTSELNTKEVLDNLREEYSAIKNAISPNRSKQSEVLEVLQGVEIELVAHHPTKSSIFSFNESLKVIQLPFAGLNPDPETWPDALEVNSKIPAPVKNLEDWFHSLAHGLRYLVDNGFTVALASAQSTTNPDLLTIGNLHKKRRTQELAEAIPGEVCGQPSETYRSRSGTVVDLSPSTISIVAGNRGMRLITPAERVLSSCTKATLGALQFHLSGDPRHQPQSSSGAHGICHNSALIATLFGLAIGGSAPVFSGVNTLVSDVRLLLYRATVGRRAPFGYAWFDDRDVLAIYDEVMTSDNPLLISLESSKRTTGNSFALSALKTIWPPLIRPTVTKNADGALNVHPEIRAIGTPQTLHDSVAICYFLAGIWKRLPDFLEAEYGIDCSSPRGLERQYPFQSFLDSVWDVSIAGLKGTVFWFDGLYHSVRDLILQKILPLADEGLVELGIPEQTRSLYLGGIRRNLELNVTSGSIELLPLQQGVTGQHKVRDLLKEIQIEVTRRSLNSFLNTRYTDPFFIADALTDSDFLEYVGSLCR